MMNESNGRMELQCELVYCISVLVFIVCFVGEGCCF